MAVNFSWSHVAINVLGEREHRPLINPESFIPEETMQFSNMRAYLLHSHPGSLYTQYEIRNKIFLPKGLASLIGVGFLNFVYFILKRINKIILVSETLC